MTLLDEFKRRTALLRQVNTADAGPRLSALLDWLEEQDLIKRAIERLNAGVNSASVFNQDRSRVRRPIARTPEEVALVGLKLIEASRAHKAGFWRVCHAHGIGFQTRNAQQATDDGMRDYVWPFIAHIEHELKRSDSPARVIDERISGSLFHEVEQVFPAAAQRLRTISTDFATANTDGEWQNIGNSCREVLKEFTLELTATLEIEIPNEVAAGNVKEVIRYCLAKANTAGRFRETLNSLIQSVWDHVAAILHRSTTTQPEARRAFVWTCLTVAEFATLVRAARSDV
ncbi:MAG: hypothetical protein DME97_07490 [Verrucomicrobia bacterium]|nr:MAG: hypothetical protein DME97_07490 [Verrucomicrobiota bacterium]